MHQYKNYLNRILASSLYAPPARENMPNTYLRPSMSMDFPFTRGFPILTGKHMPFYSILGELICFMQGRTDVRDFENMGCSVWWDNAYRWNIELRGYADRISKEEYKEQGMAQYERLDPGTTLYYAPCVCNGIAVNYNLGKIYSFYWRDPYFKDQLASMISSIKGNPFSRYHVMDSWDKRFVDSTQTAQPDCHVYFQATCCKCEFDLTKDVLSLTLDAETVERIIENSPSEIYLSGHLTQRSCDAFLGVPFNVTSYSIFTILLGIFTNTIPSEFCWTGVNNHIYSDHIDACNQYVGASTYTLPKMWIDPSIKGLEDIENIDSKEKMKSLFKLLDYKHGEKIKANLSVG